MTPCFGVHPWHAAEVDPAELAFALDEWLTRYPQADVGECGLDATPKHAATLDVQRILLQVQLGVDCNYYTKYYAPAYQPATMAFYNQRELKLGNYPFMNAYVNMKLYKTRFYVMYSHANQGLFGGSSYFGALHYPMNPSRLQFGISVDFAN